LNIGFIGAGKVGCSLGRYFAEHAQDFTAAENTDHRESSDSIMNPDRAENSDSIKNPGCHENSDSAEALTNSSLNVKGYYSRSSRSAKDAARFTHSEGYDNIRDLIDECDVIFLTVPDGSIRETWKQVKECCIKEKTICHCSGAMSSADAFEGIEETGAYGYSIHPLFAVSDKYNAYKELTGVFFTLEGGRNGRHSRHFISLRQALENMGNPTSVIDGKDKTTYHCAAAIASNLVCGLIDQSIELMTRCGFTQESAVKALAPILTGNMAHIAQAGPTESLTGPIERNDTETVRKHIECLEDENERDLYRLLSRRLVKMAQQRHPDRDYAEMSQLLGKGEKQ
jgi:predicted short-subunit dehydrogenase-like oxidoreductase (DUF2520 family)